MRPIGSAAGLEKRRRRAVELSKEGKGIREIARQVRASPGAVHRWLQDWKTHGSEALAAKPTPGRPKKLTAKQSQKLQKRLLTGAMACGFPNELWTLKRIATLIRKEFGVRYHPSHLWRVLHSCGWSCQVPETRAIQRDEEAIAHWMRHTWPAIKKSTKTWRPHRLPR
jgi:transposase